MFTELLVSSLAVAIGIYVIKNRIKRKGNLKELPGPWGLPFLGHLAFLGKNPGVTFLNWKKVYGPIFAVKFGSIPCVVINDGKLIKEALSLESFSGRPLLPNFTLISDIRGVIMGDGALQTQQRKFGSKSFKEMLTKSELEFRLQEEMSTFITNLKNKCKTKVIPNDGLLAETHMKITNLFRYPVINSIWFAIMGQRFDEGDPTLTHFCKCMKRMTDTNQSIRGQLSWFFPWISHFLNFFGVNPFINESRKIFAHLGNQIEQCRGDHVVGEPKHFTHAYFDHVTQREGPHFNLDAAKKEQQSFTGDLFLAALDTTMTSMDWLLLYMAREPNLQRKLQSEIDTVLGTNSDTPRAPSILDKIRMPYTEAVINELLRITSIVPFAIFHRTTQDVDFHGYRIPKDTMVIPNLYGVNHDPDIWHEPDTFQPARFLDNEGRFKKPSDGEYLPFSAGRRSCIGEGFARDQLFFLITSFFQQFSVSCTGNIPTTEGIFGIVIAPHPFELNILERSTTL